MSKEGIHKNLFHMSKELICKNKIDKKMGKKI